MSIAKSGAVERGLERSLTWLGAELDMAWSGA